MKFQFLNMIFNTAQRTVKFNPAWDVLKVMLKKYMIMEMKHQIDVG